MHSNKTVSFETIASGGAAAPGVTTPKQLPKNWWLRHAQTFLPNQRCS
jgi:hypothetical protein